MSQNQCTASGVIDGPSSLFYAQSGKQPPIPATGSANAGRSPEHLYYREPAGGHLCPRARPVAPSTPGQADRRCSSGPVSTSFPQMTPFFASVSLYRVVQIRQCALLKHLALSLASIRVPMGQHESRVLPSTPSAMA